MSKRSVLIYADMLDMIDEMSDAEAADTIRAIRAYLNGTEYTFRTRVAKITFCSLQSQFNRSEERFEEISQKRADAARKRWKNNKQQKKEIKDEVLETDTSPFEPSPTPTEVSSSTQAEERPPVKAKAKKQTAHHADYDWIDDSYREIFSDWLDYKKAEKKFTYKTEKTVKLCYKELVKISDGDPEKARLSVEKAMANGWQGFHPIQENIGSNGSKVNKNGNNKSSEIDKLGAELAQRCAEMLNNPNDTAMDSG